MTQAGGVAMPGAITRPGGRQRAGDARLGPGQGHRAAVRRRAGEPGSLLADGLHTPDEPAEERKGLFGPRLPVADDAPLLDRTLAYAGRDVNWAPKAVRS